jgi:hypothetical protein
MRLKLRRNLEATENTSFRITTSVYISTIRSYIVNGHVILFSNNFLLSSFTDCVVVWLIVKFWIISSFFSLFGCNCAQWCHNRPTTHDFVSAIVIMTQGMYILQLYLRDNIHVIEHLEEIFFPRERKHCIWRRKEQICFTAWGVMSNIKEEKRGVGASFSEIRHHFSNKSHILYFPIERDIS